MGTVCPEDSVASAPVSMSQDESTAPPETFPSPPQTFTDKEGREIEIREFESDQESLVAMYDDFPPEDRAQGLPPVGERQIRDWIDILADGIAVVAWHEDDAVGHATLLSCGDDTFELTIFVHHDYQLAGIGSQLIRTLLGLGQEFGVERVWLSVQRSNHVAMNLYKSVGFETTSCDGLEHEMEMSI